MNKTRPRSFNESCAQIRFPCRVGENEIDPCTCRAYFQCAVDRWSFVKRPCSRGTAWDHIQGICDSEKKVLIGENGTPICDATQPWARCESVDNAYEELDLEESCYPFFPTSYTPTITSTTEGATPASSTSGSDDTNTAAIVGGVVGGLLVVVCLIVLVVWCRKRNSRKKKEIPSLPRLDSRKDDEEVYDVIDEKAVGKVSPAEYDNPAFSQSENNEYTALDQSAYLPVTHQPNKDDEFSRSITIGGQEVVVEDADGYHVGYPSGTVARQPSPLPERANQTRSTDGGNRSSCYELETAPSAPAYLELENTPY